MFEEVYSPMLLDHGSPSMKYRFRSNSGYEQYLQQMEMLELSNSKQIDKSYDESPFVTRHNSLNYKSKRTPKLFEQIIPIKVSNDSKNSSNNKLKQNQNSVKIRKRVTSLERYFDEPSIRGYSNRKQKTGPFQTSNKFIQDIDQLKTKLQTSQKSHQLHKKFYKKQTTQRRDIQQSKQKSTSFIDLKPTQKSQQRNFKKQKKQKMLQKIMKQRLNLHTNKQIDAKLKQRHQQNSSLNELIDDLKKDIHIVWDNITQCKRQLRHQTKYNYIKEEQSTKSIKSHKKGSLSFGYDSNLKGNSRVI